ncbi:MAG TPA: DinB family protein [Chloroflexota bacterium]
MRVSDAVRSFVFHLARWADHVHVRLAGETAELSRRLGPRQQLWRAEELAARWGLDAAELGEGETGMLMDEAAAARLPLPSADVLIDYARRAFAASQEAVDAIDEAQFAAPREDDEPSKPVGETVVSHLVHNNRHLGEIECLRALLGLRGSATR